MKLKCDICYNLYSSKKHYMNIKKMFIIFIKYQMIKHVNFVIKNYTMLNHVNDMRKNVDLIVGKII